MNRLMGKEIDMRDAQDLLEDAVTTSAALLESVAALLELQVTGEDRLALFPDTALGLRHLAEVQSKNLRERFQVLVETARRTPGKEVRDESGRLDFVVEAPGFALVRSTLLCATYLSPMALDHSL
jgi:hypothetical protein